MTRTVVVWLGALLCCALWGSAFPCIKIGYQLIWKYRLELLQHRFCLQAVDSRWQEFWLLL